MDSVNERLEHYHSSKLALASYSVLSLIVESLTLLTRNLLHRFSRMYDFISSFAMLDVGAGSDNCGAPALLRHRQHGCTLLYSFDLVF